MDKKIVIGIIVLGLILLVMFTNNDDDKEVSSSVIAQDIENLHEANLEIEGMYCEACAYGVKAQLEELDGVTVANIDYKTASGTVRYDADKVDAETIAAASTVYKCKVTGDKKIN